MKYDFLGFPHQYEVGKEIKDQFLKSSTLTPGRRKLLEDRVTDIELLYDLKFNDRSEIIVLLVGIDKAVGDWTENNVAMAVASSFPHHSMVIIHNGLAAQFFTFEATVQKKDHRRMSIAKAFMSLTVNLEKLDREALQVVEDFNGAYDESSSAGIVCKKWCEAISESWKRHRHKKELDFYGLTEDKNGRVYLDLSKLDEEYREFEEWSHSLEKYLDDRQEDEMSHYAHSDWWYEYEDEGTEDDDDEWN